MMYKKGDFIKAYCTKKPSEYSLAYVVEVDMDTETYKINDVYSSTGKDTQGTLWATLKESDGVVLEKITKERFYAELI